MDSAQFDVVLNRRIELTKKVLASKRSEYAAGNSDRLHNFNRAAAMLGIDRKKALMGMLSKHLVSVLDIIDNFGLMNPSLEMIEEKIGDSINYFILLEAMMKEDYYRTNVVGLGPKGWPDVEPKEGPSQLKASVDRLAALRDKGEPDVVECVPEEKG